MQTDGFKARNLFTAADGLGCAAIVFALALTLTFTMNSPRALIADAGRI
jgi:hypothetical protein